MAKTSSNTLFMAYQAEQQERADAAQQRISTGPRMVKLSQVILKTKEWGDCPLFRVPVPRGQATTLMGIVTLIGQMVQAQGNKVPWHDAVEVITEHPTKARRSRRRQSDNGDE